MAVRDWEEDKRKVKRDVDRWNRKVQTKKEAMESMMREVQRLKTELDEMEKEKTKGRVKSRGCGKSP